MKAISILAYGADPTAQRLATSAIQQAINSAQQNDVIVIPQGRFLTGALFLKSGVSLRLDAGAQLVGSQDLADYPLINTRVAGIDMRWPAGIINIIDCENVSITGTGTIDGQGAIWWQRYWGDDERSGMVGDYSARGLRWVVDYDCQRPRNILVFESQSILLRDFTSRESGFWNMHLCYSRHIAVEGVQISNSAGPSTDGIDVDSCEQVRIERCIVSCNDDNICIKSGRGREAAQKARAARDIVIRGCTLNKGSGITLGSETSGGIERVLIEDNAFNGTGVGFRIKSARNRGGFIRDITVQNLRLTDVRFPVLIQLNWFPQYSYGDQSNLSDKPEHWRKLAEGVEGETGLTAVSGLTIKKMTARRSDSKCFSRAFFIEGYPERPVVGLTLEGILIDASEFGKISGVDGLRFKDVQVTAVEITQDRNDSYER
ncbi:glycosyl hydrolase family 28 protein [Enterobacter hormaechei]|uniref:glycoside hydrolase family 28 protein n=1 Tax=Enterobacter hormaechei TaxID=158836 RepID=UPI001E473F34|nr:glycosyl hydrolase family 28 protein [Enterobacter hormaechei]MCC4569465.1 glycoside hydrolase [Enterobacter hormaechei subsp. hoffmannii]MCC4574426.1 glycoside hydrolase [Enterobacter hormaechei subsp. hoffmannii]MCC4578971.1 glycoside hydrolase [Enterobacter hormaechei subsp. hoffmannii]MCC4583101.1 glycoside hydrolase [Enterobacter hormaechei subsp. hoffmannii]MCE1615516.1 glycosyl hydrolase family 28 protein [Enterobacter hormaechei]